MSSSDSDSGGYVRPVSKFAGLMSDDYSDEYFGEEEAKNENQDIQKDEIKSVPVVSAPPPPAAKNKKKPKQEEDDDDEEFLKAAAAKNAKNIQNAKHLSSQKKLNLNIAKELVNRFYETSFDDALKLTKNAQNQPNKFISKRKDWSAFCSTFTAKEISKDRYSIVLTEYGRKCEEESNHLHETRSLEALIMNFFSNEGNSFNVPMLIALAQLYLFNNEYNKATDMVLKLTFILQQSLPPKFINGVTKFQSNELFYTMIGFIAKFAFRRSCFDTSAEIWKFAFNIVEDDDPVYFLLSAAVPALFTEDLDFISYAINSNRTFRGIPLKYIPDWPIVEALLTYTNDSSKLEKQVLLWPLVFNETLEKPSDVPENLHSICMALRRRIKPILDKNEVQSIVDKALQKLQDPENKNQDDIKNEQKAIYEKWNSFQDEINIYQIVEEDYLPVNPENV